MLSHPATKQVIGKDEEKDVERTRKPVKCPKLKDARAKRAKLLFFIVRYANL